MTDINASPLPRFAFRVAEAAIVSGISRSALSAEIAEGRLRARKRGRPTLILASDLASYLEMLPEIDTGTGHVDE